MSLNIVEIPYSYFPDFNRGRPLYNASIYVGIVDTDPEQPINQKPVTLRQEDGTEIPAAQPILTSSGGVPIYNGGAVTILVDGSYSVKVLDNQGNQEYYSPDVTNGVPITEETLPELLSIYTDIVYKASGGNSAVENMVSGVPIPLDIGQIGSTGSSTWVRIANSGDTSDFYPLSSSRPYDFGWNDLSNVAQNTLALQSAIDNNDRVDIHQSVTVNTINLKDNLELNFFGSGRLTGTSGNKILEGLSKSNITINNMNLKGLFDGVTSNISEHGLDLQNCTDVTINNPRGRNIGGNNITATECTDINIHDLQCDGVGFLGLIFVDCTRAKLHGAIGKRINDEFAFQSKGGASDELNDVTVFAPISAGVICNANNTSGRISDGCRIRRPKIYSDNAINPGGTKGAVVFQGTNGIIDTPEIRGLTKIEGVAVYPGTDNLHIINPQIESLTNVGIDILLGVGTVIIDNPITKGMQDRGVRAQSGRIYINGGEIADNGLAGVPNLEIIDWDDFIIDGLSFKQTGAGVTKNNIKLGVSNSPGLITSSTFERTSAPDIITSTGEFRTDCPNVEVHGNSNCFVQVTIGWVERFEIKTGKVVPSGYSRSSAPSSGSWVVGDVIPYSNIAIGSYSEFICVASPNTFGTRGLIS